MLRPSHSTCMQEHFDCHCYFWLYFSHVACSIIRASEECGRWFHAVFLDLCAFSLSLSRSGGSGLSRLSGLSVVYPPVELHLHLDVTGCGLPKTITESKLQFLSVNIWDRSVFIFPAVCSSPGCWAKCSSRLNSQQRCQNVFTFSQKHLFLHATLCNDKDFPLAGCGKSIFAAWLLQTR